MTVPKKHHPKIDPTTLEEAAEWLLRLRGEEDDITAEFLSWLEADPTHREAFDRIEETWTLAGVIELKPSHGDIAIPGMRPHHTEPADDGGDRRGWRRARFLAIAAVIVMAVAGTLAFSLVNLSPDIATHVERIVTERGQHQASTLPDGSRVELGGLSALSVRFSEESRMIVVDSGEAFYEVRKDAHRPFVVQAGPVTVTAIGTKFMVRREGEAVSVVVTEGVVEVSADPSLRAKSGGETRTRGLTLRAGAGERVRFDRGELAQTVERLRPEVATSWRFGRLEFVDEPLRLVVAGVNRYAAREIVIDDPAIAELRFTGTVFESGVPSWLKGVESVFGVKVVELDARRILITRKSNDGAPK